MGDPAGPTGTPHTGSSAGAGRAPGLPGISGGWAFPECLFAVPPHLPQQFLRDVRQAESVDSETFLPVQETDGPQVSIDPFGVQFPPTGRVFPCMNHCRIQSPSLHLGGLFLCGKYPVHVPLEVKMGGNGVREGAPHPIRECWCAGVQGGDRGSGGGAGRRPSSVPSHPGARWGRRWGALRRG